jgi:hypothetical protein
MKKITFLFLITITLYSAVFAQLKPYGYKFSGNGDILSNIIFLQNGFVLDSVRNQLGAKVGNMPYRFEYDKNRKLKRDINFYRIVIRTIVNGRVVSKYLPITRDYYYNNSGAVDSLGYGHLDNNLWLNDSSGYKYYYSNDGKIISKIFSKRDTVKEIEKCFYDSVGNVICDTLINFVNKDTIITNRKYDLQNRLESIRTFNNHYQNGEIKTYKYDSSGNLNCRVLSLEKGDTLQGGFNYYFKFDESGKVVSEILSSQPNPDSTWGFNLNLDFNYSEYGKILNMGDVVRFHYNPDGNLDTLLNVHPVYCGYLGNNATLIDSYGNSIVMPDCAGYNYFYYSSAVSGINNINADNKSFVLNQNYPNPFNPATTISFTLPSNSLVSLTIFDILGRKIASLVNNETLSAGNYTKQWNASGCSSGIYFYQLKAGTFSDTKKLLLIR